MVAGPTQKTLQITDLDVTTAGLPPVPPSSGVGGPYRVTEYDGYVTPAAADGAGTLYLMARVKSTVKVKKVVIESEAQTAGKVDVGVYYADDARYLAAGNSGVAGTVIVQNEFATDVDLSSAVSPTDITNQSGNYTLAKRIQPLWQAVGLSADPGGYFDIVCSVHTTDITTGTGKLGLRVGVSEQ